MLIKTDQSIIQNYLTDSSYLSGGQADEVVFPSSEAEIIDFLQESSAKKYPVTISGGGTGVVGARIAFGGAVLATDKLDKIIDLDQKQKKLLLEPAVRLSDIHALIEKENLAYNPDSTEKSAFIGGNVATNASGARTFRYGSTRKYINYLRVVLPNGQALDIHRGSIFAKGRKIHIPQIGEVLLPNYKMPEIKNAAGYYIKDNMDLIDLFIGMEGTLGVITRIGLDLVDRPQKIFGCLAFFSKESDSLSFIRTVKEEKTKRPPLSLEFFDHNALLLLKTAYSRVPDGAQAAVFFEQETTEDLEGAHIASWLELLDQYNVSEDNTWFGDTPAKEKELIDFRWKLPELVNEIVARNKLPKVGTDIAVPDKYFEEMFALYKEKMSKSSMDYLIFGHIGDSHLHLNLLPKTAAEREKALGVYKGLIKKAVSYGGTPSAEHGIGKLKHAYLEILYGKSGIEKMKNLKRQIDPAYILNLGNIFD